MKDNWRAGIDSKANTSLVTKGKSRYSRNPAFVGFYFLYIGITVAFNSKILIIVSVKTITMFHYHVLQEEKYIKSVCLDEYTTYMQMYIDTSLFDFPNHSSNKIRVRICNSHTILYNN